MEEKENFDQRYHASYAAKLKSVPLEKVENAIAKVLGELTDDRVECTIVKFTAENKYAEIVITLDVGRDKRYCK
jgi:hypothetical protein